MHHARRPAEAHHRLVEVGQGGIHRKQAEFLVLDRLHPHTAMGKAGQQALAQHWEGHGGGEGQGGFLDKEATIAQVHGIKKGGGLAAFLLAEVIAAVVHEYELPRPNRRGAEAADDAVGGLAGYGPILPPVHKDALVAAGIQHQPGPVLLACGGGDHESLILLLPGGRLALLPANSGGGAAVQPMGLQGRFVEEAVGAAVLQEPVIS